MKLGLALAGGGMRGIAHAGILKALEENNINVDVIAGTSSGSMLSILYAIGYNGNEILNLFKKYAYDLIGNDTEIVVLNKVLFNQKIKFDGLRSGKPIEDLFNKICYEKNIIKMKDIKFPVGIVATDAGNEKEFVCSSKEIDGENFETDISVGIAVRASSSFSVVFDPCLYKDKVLLDGGIFNNVPADVARKLGADKVISVSFSSDKITKESNIIQIGMKTIDMMSNKNSKKNLIESDMVLTVDSDGTGLLDLNNIDYCFNSGYKIALENMNKIKKLIINA